MAQGSEKKTSPVLAGIAAWLVPGGGYWVLGQRTRALAIGLSVLVLFVVGLLVGGVRVVEVPGYGDHGQPLVVDTGFRGPHQIHEKTGPADEGTWVMTSGDAWDEVRNKPWYIAQILNGPVNLAASWGSVLASRAGADGQAVGARSHSHTNEMGVLYTAVAGMLNLLAIIDSAHRAGPAREDL